MTLLFICAALEQGRDGVGDYVRALAGECVRRGHACTIIALHDPFVADVVETTTFELCLIRYPADQSWAERLASATADLRRIAPDWVSWQFVAYGFHARGFLPGNLLQNARKLRGTRCHIMLHELWLGLASGSGFRERALGWLQRRGVVCLLDQLEPDVLHTSNSAYKEALGREGYAVEVLGLFGNLPVAERPSHGTSPFASWLRAGSDPADVAPLVGVTFGTLHPQWRTQATVDWLLATARRKDRVPALLALGRAGEHAARIVDCFRRGGVEVGETGELDSLTVSRLLGAADFGIAPHPWALMGKSGAAAAMLDHGLPVLVPRDDWRLRGGTPSPETETIDPLLTRLAGLGEAATDRWLAARRAPSPTLPRVADDFLQALENVSNRP